MALKPLDIFKLLPKTNCKECGFPTCLAFAMQMAIGKTELSKCPHVSEDAKAKLSEEAAPPIKTVTIGAKDVPVKLGGETVLYRHEKTFYNPTAIGVLIKESMSDAEIDKRLKNAQELKYDRVGLTLKSEVIAIQDEGKGRFKELVEKASKTGKALLLMSGSPALLKEAVQVCGENAKPVLFAADKNNWQEMSAVAKEMKTPLVVKGSSPAELAETVKNAAGAGVDELILYPESPSLPETLKNLVTIRRAAIMNKNRELGWPVLAMPFLMTDDPLKEAFYAGLSIAKYASMVILSGLSGETLFPLLLERMNIFTDPQRPMTTSEGIYEIGKPTNESPVLITTNFSLTYFIVSGEIENSRVPAYLLIQDTEGLSVLTAWAADKLNAETIAALVKKTKIEEKVSVRTLILPGVLAQISGELEDELPGWKILLGPREVAHLPAFLKNLG